MCNALIDIKVSNYECNKGQGKKKPSADPRSPWVLFTFKNLTPSMGTDPALIPDHPDFCLH